MRASSNLGSMSDFNPPPRKGPPGPPPRPKKAAGLPPDSHGVSDPDKTPANPFLVSAVNGGFEAAPPSRPTPQTLPEPQAPANPFMAVATETRAQAVPRPPSPAAPQEMGSVPMGSALQVAPIVGQPGYEAPNLKDPHAAFRKGNKLKALLFVAVAAAVVGGIVFLANQEPTEPKVAAEKESEGPVIGSSVSPEIIKDPNDEPLSARLKKTAAPVEPVPAPAPRSADNEGFANHFKAKAE